MNPLQVESLQAFDFGVAQKPMAGETASGDLHLVRAYPGGALVAAIDGVGHGQAAAGVAQIAHDVLADHAGEGVITLMRRCHAALKGTRGAVISLAAFNTQEDIMTWIGVGNVSGLLVRGGNVRSGNRSDPEYENLMVWPGLLGFKLPPLRALVIPVWKSDLLVLTTDGIAGDFSGAIPAGDVPQQTAERLSNRFGKQTDDGLVLVVRYLGAGQS